MHRSLAGLDLLGIRCQFAEEEKGFAIGRLVIEDLARFFSSLFAGSDVAEGTSQIQAGLQIIRRKLP